MKSSRVGFSAVFLLILASMISAEEPAVRIDEIQQAIRDAEYHVTWQEQTVLPDLDAAWHATNRAQNLRFYFVEDGLRVMDRTTAESPELVHLEVAGPSRGNEKPTILAASGNRFNRDHGGFTESFINEEGGLSHVVTVAGSPSGEQPAVIELDWSAAGMVVTDRSVVLRTASGRRLVYSIDHAMDATGSPVEATLSPHGGRVLLTFGDGGSVYPVTVKNILTGTADTVLEGNLDNLYFGSGVASGDLNGDGYSDIAVKVSGWDGGQTNEGALMIFHGGPGGIPSNGTGAIASSADSVIEGNVDGYLWPKSIDIVGDVNGDGFEDLMAGDDWWDPDFATYPPQGSSRNFGAVWIFEGSASGIAATDPDGADSRVVSNVSGANLGACVAGAGDVNGDGFADLMAGAPQWSNSGGQTLEGAAFLFHGSSAGITATDISGADTILEGNQTLLRAGGTLAGVGDLDGDGYDDVAAGLPLLSRPETKEGGVAVLYGSATGVAGNPSQTFADRADTLIEGNETDAELGRSIADGTDVNGDGLSDLAAGTWFWSDEPGQTGEGALLVFHGDPARISSNPTSPAVDVADTVIEGNTPTPFYSMFFGFHVVGAMDVNGDGFGDLAVTAKYFSNPETNEGAVFVFFGQDGGIPSSRVSPVVEAADIVVESNEAGLSFGEIAPDAGDVNGDGYSDLVASTHRYSSSQTDEGAVFIYHGGADTFADDPEGQYDARQSGSLLGEAAASAGDVNGDGYADLVVAAPFFEVGGERVGRVRVFHGSAGPFLSGPDWTVDGETAGEGFGHWQTSAGDVNGDGYGDLVVCLHGYSNGQSSEGRVDVYHGSESGLSSEADWSFESDHADAWFGTQAASAGDVNGDGYGDLIVGAPGYTDGESDEGRVYLFFGSSQGLSPAPDWTFESDATDAGLGSGISGAGDVNGDGFGDVIAGAVGYESGNFVEGAAYGFWGGPSGLPDVPNWFIETNRDYSYYGSPMAALGDVNGDGYGDVIVAAPNDSNPEISEGRAYIYHGSQSGLSTIADRVLERNQAYSNFGGALAGAGDVNGDGFADVIVGAPNFPSGAHPLGRAELFLGSTGGVADQPAWSIVGTSSPEAVGDAVDGGDHNGDGFSDVVVGVPGSDSGFLDSGAVQLYLGNAGAGRPVLARQYRGGDDPGPVQPWGLSSSGDAFEVSMTATSPRGRELVKMHVEACPPGEVWGDVDCRHQVSADWTEIPLGENGIVLSEILSGLTEGVLYHWRAHVLYQPLHANEPGITEPPVPRHGPWRRLFALAPAADIRVGEPQRIFIELVAAASSIGEAAPFAEVNIVMTTSDGEPAEIESSVDFDTFNGSAIAGEDYVHTSFNKYFAPGTASGTTQSIQVDLINDDLDEPDEDFAVEIHNPIGADLGPQTTHTVTILDDDPPPELSAVDIQIDEGAGLAIVSLELSGPTTYEVAANYASLNGTAVAPEDYVPVSGTAVIPPMDTAATVEIPIENDGLDEINETFTLELSGASNASLTTPSVVVTILDDDPPPELSAVDVQVDEGDGIAVVVLELSAPTSFEVTVDFATVEDTATSPDDFGHVSDTAVIPPMDTTATVEIPIEDDWSEELPETLMLELSGATNAVLITPSVTITIYDDDAGLLFVDGFESGDTSVWGNEVP